MLDHLSDGPSTVVFKSNEPMLERGEGLTASPLWRSGIRSEKDLHGCTHSLLEDITLVSS